MSQFGASFSVPYAEYLSVQPKECLAAALEDLGIRRFRLMSYWNRLEPKQGAYDFSELDWQIEMAEEFAAEVTLCLGLRQPRWPENHWPDWALKLPDVEWQQALLEFIEAVVSRYRERDCIVSYQLENEAFNKFGLRGNYDRDRLIKEFDHIKSLDTVRPVIMTTSDSWGLPIRGPHPDMFANSIYRYFYNDGRYKHPFKLPLFYRLRALMIRLLRRRKMFIHELQTEPWGPAGIPDMSLKEQFKSINPERVKEAVAFARQTGLYPIDVWGLEWWYWLKIKHANTEAWDYMRSVYRNL